jgi:TnpA family transposase
MPVGFLNDEQIRSYGQYSGDPSDEQLARYFYLDDQDLSLIRRHRGYSNRLCFALQLCTVRFLGTFLSDTKIIPAVAVRYVAQQLGDANIEAFRHIQPDRTRLRHIEEIKKHYGYKDFTDKAESFGLVRWLYNRCCLSNERPGVLFDLATARLVERKVLLPGATVLARLVSKVRDRAAKNLWSSLSGLTTPLQKQRLKGLLEVSGESRQSHLDRLRRGPVRISGPGLVDALKRVEEVRDLGVGNVDLSAFPPGRIKTLSQYAARSKAAHIEQMHDNRRTATLLGFAKTTELTAMDDALDVLDSLVDGIFKDARKAGEKKRMRTIRDLDRAALDLRKACEVLLDQDVPPSKLRDVIFGQISREELADASRRVSELARPADDNYEQEITESYRAVRRFLPRLLSTVTFSGTSGGKAVLKALDFLQSIEGKRNPDMAAAPLEGVSKAWRRRIMGQDDQISKQAYTLCTLERLHSALRRRDVFVPASTRWSDPREKLLSPVRWKKQKTRFCHTLGHPKSGEEAAEILATQIDAAYRDTMGDLDNNTALLLHPANTNRNFVLSSLDEIEEPDSLTRLRREVAARLPRVDLPEVLLEIHALTGFADEFTHISEQNARAEGLPISLCAVLVAQACNIGLKPVVDPSFPPLMQHRLSWVMQNYSRPETLIRANSPLVNYQTTNLLAGAWGGGEVASADGMRFVVPVQSIHARPNGKYFGRGRGVTYYNFTSDQFAGFHHIVIPGTLRDSMYILQGLLEHETSLNITEIMADTAGASEVVFGLFWLLGYQFSPRLADIAHARFWRCDPQADYGALNSLSRNCVKPDLFIRHWDDILRTAASLKMGTVSASELIRSLFNSKRPTALGKAIAELGKIPKTVYMLNYISDENYRRRILTQLNRGEGRHGLAREIYHGKKGELRQSYREGQEEQLGALGLVVNALILWNTIYIQAALDQLKREGYPVLLEDVARLSPLIHEHCNFLGRHSFRPEGLPPRGKLRPLRDPREQEALLVAA